MHDQNIIPYAPRKLKPYEKNYFMHDLESTIVVFFLENRDTISMR